MDWLLIVVGMVAVLGLVELLSRRMNAPWPPNPEPHVSGPSRSNVTGTIKWFSVMKGYGFIAAPEYPHDVFVFWMDLPVQYHQTGLPDGTPVVFDVVVGSRGPQAGNVRLIA